MTLIDDVKARLDIVEVVSTYTPLNKAGRNFKALCPFHTEKTPSFIVFPDRQGWRCFGACATGGDVISFVMRMEKQDFGDALKLLAQRYGVPLPERRPDGQRELLYQINQAAAQFFQGLLLSSRGLEARRYLEKRGVGVEATSDFSLGLSPPGWDTLKNHLVSLGYGESQIAEAGLLYRSDEGASRDLFRGRLMFSIHEARGRIAGFGGRSLDGSDPKYINSPKTTIFDKGSILYGLPWAAEHIRKENTSVVVEGYMDVIAAHQYGFKDVVASMGTALTERQVAQLKALAGNFILALDPDAAGQEATLRSLESSWKVFDRGGLDRRASGGVTLYARQEITLKIAILPPGNDPDQVIREDPQVWKRLIDGAQPLLDYLLAAIASRFDLGSSQGKAQATEVLFPIIAGMSNPYDQERYFDRLAQVLGVRVATLEASVGRPRAPVRARSRREANQEVSLSPFVRDQGDPLEEYALTLMLNRPELREYATGLTPECFYRSESREVFALLLRYAKIEEVETSLSDALRGHLEHLTNRSLPPMDHREGEIAIRDCLRRLEERYLKELKYQEEGFLSQEGGGAESDKMEEEILRRNEQLRKLFGSETVLRLKHE